MTFVVKLGFGHRPLPEYRDQKGCRYQYTCGWCGESFMTAAQLIAHVAQEREAAAC